MAFEDITKNKKAEDALKKVKKNSANSFETTSEGFWFLDSKRKLLMLINHFAICWVIHEMRL